ncbi:hypothetical protein [Campylobacter concisus]|jgi:lipoprotein|uniref:hypothetical protein n=1 Tax=Campylobacter concisus TaxID=199 RepID=UPI000D30A67E|nr:hypothetical protein [Campylobacter concisus]
MKKLISILTVALVLVGCGREPVVLNETNTLAFYNDFGLNIRMIVATEKECPKDILVSEISKYMDKDPKHRDPKISCTVHESGMSTSKYFVYDFKDNKFVRNPDKRFTFIPTIPFFSWAEGLDDAGLRIILRLNRKELQILSKSLSEVRGSNFESLNEGNQFPLIGLDEVKDLLLLKEDTNINYDNWIIYEPDNDSDRNRWYKVFPSDIRKVFIFGKDTSDKGIEDKYYNSVIDIKKFREYKKKNESLVIVGTTKDRK